MALKKQKGGQKLTSDKNEEMQRNPGPQEEAWKGLDSIGDGDKVRSFIEQVEKAFEALHQPVENFADDEDEEKPIDQARFVEWVERVEERMEDMGLAHRAHGLPDKPGIPIDAAALQKWTRYVYTRFAGKGQVLPEPGEEF